MESIKIYGKISPLLSINTITFDTTSFIKDTLHSYDSNESILKQFIVDCPRSNIYVNNNRIITDEEMNRSLMYLSKIKIDNDDMDGKINNMAELIKFLTLQSTYAFPYIYLHNIYVVNNNICDMLSSTSKNRNIYINMLNGHIRIILECQLDLKNMDFSTSGSINVTIYIKINNKNGKVDKNSLIVWEIIN